MFDISGVCVCIYPETNTCWCNQDATLMAAVFHFRVFVTGSGIVRVGLLMQLPGSLNGTNPS